MISSSAFLKSWGIVTLDFESQEDSWGHHTPKDADVMMLAQAVQMKAMAPDTKIYVYRNLAQAYANFAQFREKLEDPRHSTRFGAGVKPACVCPIACLSGDHFLTGWLRP
jgi:hypothetical protein